MEFLENRYVLGNIHPDSLTEETCNRQDIVKKLIRFITLTKVDRLKAGIYVGKEGRDWIDRSALIISPPAGLEEFNVQEHEM